MKTLVITDLTEREGEVLGLTSEGLGAGEIADLLDLGLSRVKRVKRQVKTKLRLPAGADTTDMLRAARKRGLIR